MGIKMKKIICLLLALTCVFAFASCNEDENPDKAFFDIVNASEPTRIKTLTAYAVGEDDPLNGTYETVINDDGVVFNYSFQRYATIEDAENPDLEIDGNVVTESGKVYYKDGRYSTDNENWFSEAPDVAASAITLNLSLETLTEYELNDAKTTLTATLSADEAEAVLGVKLSADGDIALSVSTNGTYLTRVSVEYKTANATVTINTSYS